MVNRKSLFGLVAALMTGLALAAPTGSCEREAVSLSGARPFTLTNEYIDNVRQTNGVFYFKATLKRSNAYTVYTDGITTNQNITLMAYPAEAVKEDQFEPSADFDELDERAGNQRLVMYADDWYIDEEDSSESDPSSWTYYFLLQGPVGERGTIVFQQGVNIPIGRATNPQTITPSTTAQTVSNHTLEINGEYHFKARLQAGRLYCFTTSKATEETSLDVAVEAYEDEDLAVPAIFSNPDYDSSNDSSLYVIPAESGLYSIVVSGLSSEDDQKPFGLTHVMYANRTPAQHPSVELNAGNGYAADFTAGRLMAPGSPFYDEVIDESLFSFAALKGDRFVVSTEGASTNLMMRLYDAKGTILAENLADGSGGFDVRTAFQASLAGTYYVGVCQVLENPVVDEAAYSPVHLVLENAAAIDGQPDEWDAADDVPATATGLSPLPGPSSQPPETVDVEGHGWHRLGKSDWCDTFVIGGRKGVTYRLTTTLDDPTATKNTLVAEVFTLSGASERVVPFSGNATAGSETPLTFTATAHQPYYVRLSVAEGQGLDYPDYKVHVSAYQTGASGLSILTVNTYGAPATWSIDSESIKYPGGSSILVSGEHVVKFAAATGFKPPVQQKVTVDGGTVPTVVEGYYTDTFDPKDDKPAGATSWSLKNVAQTMTRTLWADDPEDGFSFASADGCYYDFALKSADCEAVFSITNAQLGVLAEDVTSVSRLVIPKTTPKTYLVVKHAEGASKFGGYQLTGSFANVGAIKFAKTAISVKENAATVAVTVNRTAKDGVVRVAYGTVAGTARPGVDYVPQTGMLEWAANDNKAKTITVALIPDLVEIDEGAAKTFSVRIRPLDAEDLAPGEYEAAIGGGDTCTITLTEAAKKGETVASAYAAKAPKLATVKTETVALETGKFTALLKEDGYALTNGLPQLASLTLTASTANPAALSAKVMLAGKTYTFSGKGWDEGEDGTTVRKELALVQKVNNVSYTNTLSLTVAKGRTETPDDWLRAGGEVELVMNVPDANNKGVQEEIHYTGELFRNNAKIQDYLTAVTNFAGYYTMALDTGAVVAEGVPAGYGYLTVTVDNKGTAKVAGLLADGTTKPSLSVTACAIRPYDESVNGYALEIPVYFAKAPVCFGGVMRLTAIDDPDQPSGAQTRVVVDASRTFVWNNDNPAVTYYNEDGYRFDGVIPCGGWYDTVFNLQTYYLNYALSVGTADIVEFPTEALTAGYVYSTAQPNGFGAAWQGNNLVLPKKTMVKSGTLVDFDQSVNPCNVQVKIARATGLVTGSCSLWSETEDGLKQKEMTGLKVYGVLVPTRDPYASLTDEYIAPGFVTQSVKLTDYNEETKRTSTRNWTFSAPFTLMGEDQGEIDWWADDWGSEFN